MQRLSLIRVSSVRAAFGPVSGTTAVCLQAADCGKAQTHTGTTG